MIRVGFTCYLLSFLIPLKGQRHCLSPRGVSLQLSMFDITFDELMPLLSHYPSTPPIVVSLHIQLIITNIFYCPVPQSLDIFACQNSRASLVAQWLRICLPRQGTRVRALVWEDPTCRGAAGPVSHKYWACTSGACAPQQERPRQWEARTPRWRVAPACCN